VRLDAPRVGSHPPPLVLITDCWTRHSGSCASSAVLWRTLLRRRVYRAATTSRAGVRLRSARHCQRRECGSASALSARPTLGASPLLLCPPDFLAYQHTQLAHGG